MLEITNISKSPIQILVKSTKGAYLKKQNGCLDTTRAFKSINIPGLGHGKNVILIEDEKVTDQINIIKKQGLIKTRPISDAKLN